MKKIFKPTIIFAAILTLSSCMDDLYPTKTIISSQIGKSPAALEALSEATATFMITHKPFGQYDSQEYGYPAQMRIKDAMTADVPVVDGYNYLGSPWGGLTATLASGNGITVTWRFYYTLIFNAHNLINAVDPEDESVPEGKLHLGNALFYRALAYFDLVRMYEYKKSGIPALDNKADADKIWGLTVPLVNEHTTGIDAQNNPRRMYYEMYRFILTDLNRAEEYLREYVRPKKSRADLSVIHAYKARFWLELATRFQFNPDDLTTVLSHENDPELEHYHKFGITSAEDCYKKAAEYARLVIGKGYTPLTQNQWHNTNSGFNNSSSQSWVFATIIPGPESVGSPYYSFIGGLSPEYDPGVGTSTYSPTMISKQLFDEISDSDWRKATWIDPADQGKNPNRSKYATLLTDEEWKKMPNYSNFKFRPKDGIRADYKTGGAIDLPVVRVEEMYFIEAEALAYTQGLQAGIAALESFVNTYRYTDGSYQCEAEDVNDFVNNHLILQKRIEFWGEGIVFYDLKRRSIQIERGYIGTNFPESYRYNSLPGYCAPWLNCYFPNSGEANRNKGIIHNPDPNIKENLELWKP